MRLNYDRIVGPPRPAGGGRLNAGSAAGGSTRNGGGRARHPPTRRRRRAGARRRLRRAAVPGSIASRSAQVIPTGRLPQLPAVEEGELALALGECVALAQRVTGRSVNSRPLQRSVPPRRRSRGANSPTTDPVASLASVVRRRKPRRVKRQPLPAASSALALSENSPSSRTVPIPSSGAESSVAGRARGLALGHEVPFLRDLASLDEPVPAPATTSPYRRPT